MAPPRQRTTAIVDDSRSEASSGTKEFKATTNKRKTAANKDKAPVTSAPVNPEVAEEQPKVCTLQSLFFPLPRTRERRQSNLDLPQARCTCYKRPSRDKAQNSMLI